MTECPRLRICPVGDAQAHWPELAKIMCAAWPEWYATGQGDALGDLRARSGADLPQGWVAIHNAVPVGTVALAATSYGAEQDEAPWVIGLVVAPEMRGRGIATHLVRHVMAQSSEDLFTTTRAAIPLFLRLGWRDLRPVEDGWRVLTLSH